MSENRTLEILKAAILLERRGKAFYEAAAEKAEGAAVKELFQTMAKEEDDHVRELSEQYKAFAQDGKFASKEYSREEHHEAASTVLSDELRNEISAASFEAAAIAAAIQLELRAIELYRERAKSAEDPQERELYEWLSKWEVGHLEFLNEIDHELTAKVWSDNTFWPF